MGEGGEREKQRKEKKERCECAKESGTWIRQSVIAGLVPAIYGRFAVLEIS